ALLEAEADMKKTTEEENVKLSQELENMRALFSDLQVSNNHLSQQVATLQEHVSGEEKLKAAFEEFKQYEDNRVEQRCTKMDARLDALSIDFDEELYPHMLTAIVGRRWMIGRELRLASDTGDDVPQQVRDLRPSSSQLTIPVYPEVRDPMNPWAYKEEMLPADAIAANVSHAEKKKKCRIVCRTHGVGSAHHARSDGVPVSPSSSITVDVSFSFMELFSSTSTSTCLDKQGRGGVPGEPVTDPRRRFEWALGAATEGYTCVHGGFRYGARNEEGRVILDFATAHDFGIVNSHFKKRDHHLLTF
nr:hypothetical protein [Tanacetum cinerariifolium]